MKNENNNFDYDIAQNIHIIKNTILAFSLVVGFGLLSYFESLLLPLVFATLVSFLYVPISDKLKEKNVNPKFIVPLLVIITLSFFALSFQAFSMAISSVIEEQDALVSDFSKQFTPLYEWLSEFLPRDQLESGREQVVSLFTTALSSFGTGLGQFTSSFGTFAIYLFFMTLGITNYKNFIHYVAGGDSEALKSLETVQKTISSYLGIKTAMSLITGVLIFILCTFTGLRFPIVWAFLAFALNFIPSLGSLLAVLFIATMAFIQFGTTAPFWVATVGAGAIEFVIGNFLDPRIMGDKTNINTVSIIFGLIFWGSIWGIGGALLSVPLLVILKLILEKNPSWSQLVRLLSNTPEDFQTDSEKKS